MSKNFQQQSCNAINYLWYCVNILAGNNPAPVKFGPKGTDPQYVGCAFQTQRAVQSAIADLLVKNLRWWMAAIL